MSKNEAFGFANDVKLLQDYSKAKKTILFLYCSDSVGKKF